MSQTWDINDQKKFLKAWSKFHRYVIDIHRCFINVSSLFHPLKIWNMTGISAILIDVVLGWHADGREMEAKWNTDDSDYIYVQAICIWSSAKMKHLWHPLIKRCGINLSASGIEWNSSEIGDILCHRFSIPAGYFDFCFSLTKPHILHCQVGHLFHQGPRIMEHGDNFPLIWINDKVSHSYSLTICFKGQL